MWPRRPPLAQGRGLPLLDVVRRKGTGKPDSPLAGLLLRPSRAAGGEDIRAPAGLTNHLLLETVAKGAVSVISVWLNASTLRCTVASSCLANCIRLHVRDITG